MPCRRFGFCRRRADSCAVLPAPTSNPDVEEWWQIRRKDLRAMRRQTRMIVFLMAAMEIMKIGPVQLVYAGRHGYAEAGPQDFGFAYSVGYFLSWIYVCAFMVVWVPLFSWWVPKTDDDSAQDSKLGKVAEFLKRLNLILLPIAISLSLVQHVCYLVHTFVYVDSRAKGSRKLPKNTKKNWIARFMIVSGIAVAILMGNGALGILDDMDLAHVKEVEYYVILLPMMVNFGVFFGTVAQHKMEKRHAKKMARKTMLNNIVNSVSETLSRAVGNGTQDADAKNDDEKQALLEQA